MKGSQEGDMDISTFRPLLKGSTGLSIPVKCSKFNAKLTHFLLHFM